jgi:hypothetical protein
MESRVTIPSGDLELEGVLHLPEAKEFPGVVVCHPHPLYGGNMDNNVVMAVCQALVERSIAALRFNFRGVGRSLGKFEQGVGEKEDVRAALSFLEAKTSRLGLAGYSFGATVAISVAPEEPRVRALAFISPPLFPPGLEPLKTITEAKFFISGSADVFIPSMHLRRSIEQLPPPHELKVILGADHFWWGYEDIVGKMIADFFAANL